MMGPGSPGICSGFWFKGSPYPVLTIVLHAAIAPMVKE